MNAERLGLIIRAITDDMQKTDIVTKLKALLDALTNYIGGPNEQLQEQIIYGRIYRSIAELRDAVRRFAEQYNAQWIVEKNGYLSPANARQGWDTAMSLRLAA